jgi:hypothetical protein
VERFAKTVELAVAVVEAAEFVDDSLTPPDSVVTPSDI